jgi:nitrogen fixation protein FixH
MIGQGTERERRYMSWGSSVPDPVEMSMVTYAYDITSGLLIHNNHNAGSLFNLVSKNRHLAGRSTDVKIASRLAVINLVASTSAHFRLGPSL